MLWIQAPAVASLQTLVSRLFQTKLGGYLSLKTTLFGIVGQSTYVKKQTRQEQAINEQNRLPFLIIYPFTKTKEWYLVPFEERKEMMMDHIRLGHAHASIRQLLLYAFGVDDHEFIVSYETEKLEDFQQLIIDLRATKVRLYTANDLPIFPCVYGSIEWVMELV